MAVQVTIFAVRENSLGTFNVTSQKKAIDHHDKNDHLYKATQKRRKGAHHRAHLGKLRKGGELGRPRKGSVGVRRRVAAALAHGRNGKDRRVGRAGDVLQHLDLGGERLARILRGHGDEDRGGALQAEASRHVVVRVQHRLPVLAARGGALRGDARGGTVQEKSPGALDLQAVAQVQVRLLNENAARPAAADGTGHASAGARRRVVQHIRGPTLRDLHLVVDRAGLAADGFLLHQAAAVHIVDVRPQRRPQRAAVDVGLRQDGKRRVQNRWSGRGQHGEQSHEHPRDGGRRHRQRHRTGACGLNNSDR